LLAFLLALLLATFYRAGVGRLGTLAFETSISLSKKALEAIAIPLTFVLSLFCAPLGRHPAMKSSVVFIPPAPSPLVAPPQPRASRRRKLSSLRLLSLGY